MSEIAILQKENANLRKRLTFDECIKIIFDSLVIMMLKNNIESFDVNLLFGLRQELKKNPLVVEN